jgi:hypothetical protein
MSIPFFLITPKHAKGKMPVVLMVSSSGKQAFLKERGAAIAAFLEAGVAVCLPDVRGTGETRSADGSAGRGSSRTSISQTELILGQTVMGSQLRDLRSVLRWLRTRKDVDASKLAVWGDSFAKVNPQDAKLAAPLDAPDLPAIAEPGGSLLAAFAGLFEGRTTVLYARGGLASYVQMIESPYLYVPHDIVVPDAVSSGDLMILFLSTARYHLDEITVDGRNRGDGDKALSPADAAALVIKQLSMTK